MQEFQSKGPSSVIEEEEKEEEIPTFIQVSFQMIDVNLEC